MKRLNKTLVVGWFAYAIAWFLPVHEFGAALSDGWLPGWQAAVGCLFGDLGPFGVASSATNFIMLLTVPLALLATGRRLLAGAVGCGVAALLIWVWIPLFLSDGGGLRAGYYMWSVSFAIVGVGLWRLVRQRQGSEGAPGSTVGMLPIT